MNVLPTSPKNHPKKSTKDPLPWVVSHRGFPAASRILWCRISRGSSLQIKRPASTLALKFINGLVVSNGMNDEQMTIWWNPSQEKRHLSNPMKSISNTNVWKCDPSGRINAWEKNKKHHLPLNALNILLPFSLGGCIGISSKFASRFKDWTPFGESNGPSQ